MENQDGKRVMPDAGMPRGAKIALGIVLALVVLVAAGYVGLCAYVGSSQTMLPNTAASGVELGGLTPEQATQELTRALGARYAGQSVTFTCAGQSFTVSGDQLSMETDNAVAALWDAGHSGSFLTGGVRFLSALLGATEVDVALRLDSGAPALEQAAQAVSNPEQETAWSVEDNRIVFTKGRTGQTVNTDALIAQILEQFESQSFQTIEASIITAAPAQPDFDAIYNQVHREPQDAYLNPDTKEIVEAVIGVGFEVDEAARALEATEEGGTCSVPLVYNDPAVTTKRLRAILFRDVLGTSTTYCSGNSNRIANIKTAAKKIDGMILMPGGVFSYNDSLGPYTTSSGYLPAGTYQGGKSVDALAGGICQLSSTLYWTTLKSNLEITERHNHQLNVDYLPLGCDATVWGGGADFKFSNNTGEPMQILTSMEGRNLTVTLMGTNETGQYAKMESVVLSKDPCQIVYKADESVPAGSAPQKDPAYPGHNGYRVEAYRVVYGKDGNEISHTLESTNKYARQDKVMLYNPADAAALGIDPATGKKTLTPVVTPTPTPPPSADPAVTPTPPATPGADVTPTPAVTPSPAVTPAPEPTPAPTPTPDGGPGMEPVEEQPSPTLELPAEPAPTPTPVQEPIPASESPADQP